jgi:uncharacterized protein (TIGR02444 family)
MTAEALWPYALEVYGREGVEPLLLELQDAHGQCVPLLLWSLWMSASGRSVAPATLRSGAELARAWQDAAVAPLRTIRRDLKNAGRAGTEPARERLRGGVQALELEAERMLLQMLQDVSPAPTGPSGDRLVGLEEVTLAWGGRCPAELLRRLAAATT